MFLLPVLVFASLTNYGVNAVDDVRGVMCVMIRSQRVVSIRFNPADGTFTPGVLNVPMGARVTITSTGDKINLVDIC